MGFDRRDPWEAARIHAGQGRRDRQSEEPNVDDTQTVPRASDGRAPDVMRIGGWMPMREYRENEPVDLPSSAPVLAALRWRAASQSMASRSWLSMPAHGGVRWRSSHPTRNISRSSTGPMSGSCDGNNPIVLGANNSGKAVGGSTVHFAMVSLRFRPEWFRSRSLLGYAADWPLDWREMWHYYDEVERTLNIAGPVNYPWGPKRPRYPYRPHELNAAALVLARGCEALGIDWTADTARHALGAARPRASLRLSRLLHRRLFHQRQAERAGHLDSAGGARRRGDPRPRDGRAHRDKRCRPLHRRSLSARRRWRFQRARNVVVAGYAIETPRLLLMSATSRFPDGLANSSGLVGRNLMVQTNQAVWACFDEEIRWYKGPPSLALTEHWNYRHRQGLLRRLCLHEPGAVAAAMGSDADRQPRTLGHRAAARDGEIHPPGRSEDRRRSAAAGEQPRHTRR